MSCKKNHLALQGLILFRILGSTHENASKPGTFFQGYHPAQPSPMISWSHILYHFPSVFIHRPNVKSANWQYVRKLLPVSDILIAVNPQEKKWNMIFCYWGGGVGVHKNINPHGHC